MFSFKPKLQSISQAFYGLALNLKHNVIHTPIYHTYSSCTKKIYVSPSMVRIVFSIKSFHCRLKMSSEKSSTDTESQHKVIFLSEEDAATPSTVMMTRTP